MGQSSLLIPSLMHQSQIEYFCEKLFDIGEIKYVWIHFVFDEKKQCSLSNFPRDFLELYQRERYARYNYSAYSDFIANGDDYVYTEKDYLAIRLKRLLEKSYQIYPTYSLVRGTPECTFVLHALHSHRVSDPKKRYKKTVSAFEEFCIEFIEKNSDIIKLYFPWVKRALVLSDPHYLRAAIKQTYDMHTKLSERETQCLFWAALGKSSEETALILKSAKMTVDRHRKHIKDKLNCCNMAQAVYEAMKLGYLGVFQEKNQIAKYAPQTNPPPQ